MTDFARIEAGLKALLKSLSDLRELGIITNKKDFTCQLGEWLVAVIYNGTRASNGAQKHWDIQAGERFIQVKAHAKAYTTTAKWSVVKYDTTAQIDDLIIVIFTPDYKLKSFYKVPWKIALTQIIREKKRDVIRWGHLRDYEIKIDELPKQDLVALFR